MTWTRRLRLGGGSDLAIDLGTANTLVYVRGRGIAVSEPSVVAQHTSTNRVLAVGDEAKRMIGRTPATITASRPLRHGVIADLEVTEEMLRQFIARVHRGRLTHPRVVMCVPSGLTGVELSAVQEACLSAGALEVHLIDEPIAAAVGAGLDISVPSGRMVVDVGGGTSEVAVISMGAMVVQRSLRMAGYDFDDALIGWLRRAYGLIVGQPTAEALKMELGSAGVGGRRYGEVVLYRRDVRALRFSVRRPSSERPAPSATQVSGESARRAGIPVCSPSSSGKPGSSELPPASRMPLSAMSPASSGGVCSSAARTA